MATKQTKRRSLLGSKLSNAASNHSSTPAEDIASNSEKSGNASHRAFAKLKHFFHRSTVDTEIDEIQDLSDTDLKPLKDFNEVVANYPKVHPYPQVVLGIFTNISQSFVNQASVDKGISSLFDTIKRVYEFLAEEDTPKKMINKKVTVDTSAKPSWYTYAKPAPEPTADTPPKITLDTSATAALDTLAKIAQVTSDSTQFIRNYSMTKRFWKRTGKDTLSETQTIVNACTKTLDDLMQQYRDPKEDDAEIQINTYRGLGDISLEGLACADGAGLFDSRRCLDGTRTEVLTEIVSWVYNTNEDVPRILWLNGQDGAGKSTIAHTIVRWFTDAGGLGACFCFARDRLVERREERIFTTIARDLAESDLAFRRALADAVSKDPSLKTTYDVTLQWQRLILEPLSKVSGRIVGNVVVLIDDLDESGPDTSRSHILSLFTSAAAVHLPANLRILLTSRALPDIEPVLRAVSHVKVISLDELLEESARDITFWVQQDLSRARDIGTTDIQMLVERANGAFEWARLACDYIKPNRPGQTAWERWEELMALESKGRRTLLDAVHEQVLDGIIPNDRLTVSRFQSVMKQVMSAKKPMTIDALNVQRKQFPNEEDLYDVGIIVEFMRTLLVGIHNRSSPVRLRHGSFYDCVTDPERSPTYFVCHASELR